MPYILFCLYPPIIFKTIAYRSTSFLEHNQTDIQCPVVCQWRLDGGPERGSHFSASFDLYQLLVIILIGKYKSVLIPPDKEFFKSFFICLCANCFSMIKDSDYLI